MPPPESPRGYAGISADDRRAARRARLLDAAAELAATGGRQAVTLRAVCRVAGLNQRYFYESFATVDDLLRSFFDEFVAQGVQGAVEAIQAGGRTSRDVTRAVVVSMVELFEGTAGTQSEKAILETLGTDAVWAARTEVVERSAALVAGGIDAMTGRGERGPGSTRIVAHFVAGGLIDTLIAWGTGRLEATRDEIIEQCTDVFMAAVNTTSNSA